MHVRPHDITAGPRQTCPFHFCPFPSKQTQYQNEQTAHSSSRSAFECYAKNVPLIKTCCFSLESPHGWFQRNTQSWRSQWHKWRMKLGINVFKEPGSPLCYFTPPLSQLRLLRVAPPHVYHHTTIIQPRFSLLWTRAASGLEMKTGESKCRSKLQKIRKKERKERNWNERHLHLKHYGCDWCLQG